MPARTTLAKNRNTMRPCTYVFTYIYIYVAGANVGKEAVHASAHNPKLDKKKSNTMRQDK